MKIQKRDMSPEAIRARYRACWEKPKPTPAKVVRAVEMSAELAEEADANPRDVRITTRRADGVTRMERVIVIEATTRELEAKGLAFAKPEYYQRLDEALRYQPDKGSVTHSYDPFAGMSGEGE